MTNCIRSTCVRNRKETAAHHASGGHGWGRPADEGSRDLKSSVVADIADKMVFMGVPPAGPDRQSLHSPCFRTGRMIRFSAYLNRCNVHYGLQLWGYKSII